MGLTWAESRMLAFDLESDGTDPTTARAVQVACVDLVPAERGVATAPAYTVDRWVRLIDRGPDFVMAPEAQAVHGITAERLRAEGEPAADVFTQVAAKLAAVWADGGVVVGHNLGGYDLELARTELRRLGRDLHIAGGVIDTLTLDRCDKLDRADRFRKNTDLAPDGKPVRSRQLVDAVRWWEVPMDEALAHDACEDALAAARVAWRIARRYAAIAAMGIDELMTYQTEQHAAWAENFEAYKRRRMTEDGEPQAAIDAVHIPRDWPLRRPNAQEVAA